jgi:hypothetical protein
MMPTKRRLFYKIDSMALCMTYLLELLKRCRTTPATVNSWENLFCGERWCRLTTAIVAAYIHICMHNNTRPREANKRTCCIIYIYIIDTHSTGICRYMYLKETGTKVWTTFPNSQTIQYRCRERSAALARVPIDPQTTVVGGSGCCARSLAFAREDLMVLIAPKNSLQTSKLTVACRHRDTKAN